jgi:hypothetical protein
MTMSPIPNIADPLRKARGQTTITRDRTKPTPNVPASDAHTGRTGQLSTFDRLIWGRGQEPVIEG